MRRKLFYNVVGLMLLSGMFAACADKPKSGRTDTYSTVAL